MKKKSLLIIVGVLFLAIIIFVAVKIKPQFQSARLTGLPRIDPSSIDIARRIDFAVLRPDAEIEALSQTYSAVNLHGDNFVRIQFDIKNNGPGTIPTTLPILVYVEQTQSVIYKSQSEIFLQNSLGPNEKITVAVYLKKFSIRKDNFYRICAGVENVSTSCWSADIFDIQ